ncbi:MAG TPA: endonuclease III [Clostridia bacterium]|nr:endonuclease III [Clostridia bacterium]
MNKALKVLELLKIAHPNAQCELNFSTPFELLVAVILSAQCTDKRVNMVTKDLFLTLNKPMHFAEIPQDKLEEKIHSCGFYHNKAKNLIACSKSILDRFGGVVPNTVGELVTLDGVGRKTANVVFAVAFGGDAIAVDTHVFRVANRIGLANAKTPEDTEQQLMSVIPKNLWSDAHHYILFHGRYVCHSQKPKCDECTVREFCDYANNKM